MGKYALIKDGVLVNVIVADDAFIEVIRGDYDAVVDYDEHPQNPSPGAEAIEHDQQWVFTDVIAEIPAPALTVAEPVEDLVEQPADLIEEEAS